MLSPGRLTLSGATPKRSTAQKTAGWGLTLVLESRTVLLDWCKPFRERRYAIPVSEDAHYAAHEFLNSQIGQKYNYRDILGLLIHKRVWSPQRVICSQLMLEFMQEAGLQPLNVIESFSAMVTPEMLHLSPLFIGRCVYNE